MKYFILGIVALLLFSCNPTSSNNQNQKGENIAIDTVLFSNPTDITFQDTALNLGDVKADEKTKIVYHYTNSGDKPLMLFNVRPGCGCTIADFSNKPLEPGKSDSIVAFFDSKNKEGQYMKSIMVNSNTTQPNTRLVFKVNVIK